MNMLFEALDFVVLLLLVIHVVRWVSSGVANAPGGIVLTICVTLTAAFLATVSLTVYIGLVESGSSFWRLIYLAIVVAMGLIVAMSRTGKASA